MDDLLIESKDPQRVVDALMNKHYFKLKGTGPISYHAGCDFAIDEDDTLHFAPRKCNEKIEECYHSMFGSNPKQTCVSPFEKGDHPELDTSHYLDQEGVHKYQSLVGVHNGPYRWGDYTLM